MNKHFKKLNETPESIRELALWRHAFNVLWEAGMLKDYLPEDWNSHNKNDKINDFVMEWRKTEFKAKGTEEEMIAYIKKILSNTYRSLTKQTYDMNITVRMSYTLFVERAWEVLAKAAILKYLTPKKYVDGIEYQLAAELAKTMRSNVARYKKWIDDEQDNFKKDFAKLEFGGKVMSERDQAGAMNLVKYFSK